MTGLTIAVSEDAFKDVFGAFRDSFEFTTSDSVDQGKFTAGYDLDVELRDGDVTLDSPNEITVEDLHVFYKTLKVYAGYDISEQSIGGKCFATPFGKVCPPKIPLFTKDPDLGIALDLSGLITSEVRFTAKTTVDYAENHPPSVSYLAAQETTPPSVNEWEVYIDPDVVDVDLLDVEAIVGSLVEKAIDNAIDAVLSPLPSIVKKTAMKIVKGLLKPAIDLFKQLLDLTDDVFEWLSKFLGQTLGVFNTIAEAIADYLLSDSILEIEDPYPILDADPGVPLIPVKIPITDLSVTVDDDVELVVTADIGATS